MRRPSETPPPYLYRGGDSKWGKLLKALKQELLSRLTLFSSRSTSDPLTPNSQRRPCYNVVDKAQNFLLWLLTTRLAGRLDTMYSCPLLR